MNLLRFSQLKTVPGKASSMRSVLNNIVVRFNHDEPSPTYPTNAGWINRRSIGNREVVGHGRNGVAGYTDHVFCPFPAIRYKVFEGDLLLLREKEKGDWRLLSKTEKKTLYRTSFRQTIAEFTKNNAYADTEMLGALGLGMVIIAAALFYYAMLKAWLLPHLPISMTRAGWEATINKQIALRWNPMTGIASHWDYDNERWQPGFRPWFIDYLPQDSPLRETNKKE